MACVAELAFQLAAAPSLLGADGGALERLAAASGVRAAVLVADGTCRVRLAGALSACCVAEAALWHSAGEGAADAAGWFYIDPGARIHGPCATAQLAAWWRAGYWKADLPVRNGASTAWLPVGVLLGGVTPARAVDMEVDEQAASAAADELAAWRAAGGASDDDACMTDALPPVTASHADTVMLVIDTNVLLSRFALLRRAATALRGAAVALVPWTAVCELDGLKNSQAPGVARLARDANAALAAAMAAADPFFRGESAADSRTAAAEADATAPSGRASGDDRILASALRLRHGGAAVLLVTNDTNLRLKALVNGLPAFTADALPTTPQALAAAAAAPPPPPPPPALLRAPSAEAAPPPLPPHLPPPALLRAPSAEAAPALSLPAVVSLPAEPPQPAAALPRAAPSPSPEALAAAPGAALACVARGAAPVLEALLRAELEALFADVVSEATPFSGRDALRVLKRHWNACFRHALPARAAAAGAALHEACCAAARRDASASASSTARAAATAAAELLGALPQPEDAVAAAALAAARADAAALLRSLM
jgi:hypothetical protein